jgi:TonB family protein
MRKPILTNFCLVALILVYSGVVFAQSEPFAIFSRAVKEERGGFSGNKENLSRVFNEVRIGLGAEFEFELWKYLSDDAEKHYWLSLFLTSRSYLHGNEPLPELARQIQIKALSLLAERDDLESRGRVVSINRRLAISSKLDGNQEDAVRFRDKAEFEINEYGKSLSPYIAGQTDYDNCVYRNIESSIDECDPVPRPKERVVSAGWLNNRALNFANPEYPREITGKRSQARVDVGILTDANGNVETANIIRGPSQFHNAALEAAKRLKFTPTLLSGVPVKVSGWVSFDFQP